MIVSIDLLLADLGLIAAEDASRLFSELAEASIRGHHLVLCRRELLPWIEASEGLGAHVRSHFRKLAQEFAQSAGLLSSNPPRMSIVLGAEFVKDVNVWLVGHQRILNGALLWPPNLIVEDADSDGSFLEAVLPLHARSRRMPDIRFAVVNGGGAGTYRRLRRSIEEQRVSVCVCDHDMLARFTSSSVTLRKSMAEGRRHLFLGSVLTLPAREIENLLPLEIVVKVMRVAGNQDYQHVWELVERQEECTPGDCLWLFFDVKKGVNAERLRAVCIDQRAKDWIVDKYNLPDWDAVDSLELPGFGDNVVRRFLEDGQSVGSMHRFVRDGYWSKHFDSFASLLCWFFAARAQERV